MKKAEGNMYEWVTHTHSHLRGKCPHDCPYCYVQAMARRYPNMAKKYSGPVELDPNSLKDNYGDCNTIFIDHLNDLWARPVSAGIICAVLLHCERYPDNSYVFQTKNPGRYLEFCHCIPGRSYLGTTIETNRKTPGNAPQAKDRVDGMRQIPKGFIRFITIEPLLIFDLRKFADLIEAAQPQFVNIGADSKGHGLEEPTYAQAMALSEMLKLRHIEVRCKSNLDRLK